MQKLISVVIPTLNEETVIGGCLEQFNDLDGQWEIIVADSGSGDQTVEIARRAGVRVIENAPEGRGVAMNAGAALATGEILLFLHADTFLPPGSYNQIISSLSHPVVSATGFRIQVDRREWRYRMLSWIGTLRFRLQRTFFGDQAMAVRRRDFQHIGGFQERRLMEDVELSRRLRRRGRLALLDGKVTTSARRFEQRGVARTLLVMSFFQIAYRLGVPADRLNRWYADVRGRQDAATPSSKVVGLASLRFVDREEEEIRLSDLAGQPVLLVFLRWLG